MIPKSKGTYILVLELTHPLKLTVGKSGQYDFAAGFYLYVGSAHGPGGLAARLGRHFRREKTRRWHVDYLRAHARAVGAFVVDGSERLECTWAAWLVRCGVAEHFGFGASDCRCRSHLFSVTSCRAFEEIRRALTRELNVDFVSAWNTSEDGP